MSPINNFQILTKKHIGRLQQVYSFLFVSRSILVNAKSMSILTSLMW
jgi:hypothetical protein